MSPWRRFIRWLARDEIMLVRAEEKAVAEMSAHFERRASYAEGQQVGRQEMYDHIDEAVRERMGGAIDFVNPEDLARAKKGLLH